MCFSSVVAEYSCVSILGRLCAGHCLLRLEEIIENYIVTYKVVRLVKDTFQQLVRMASHVGLRNPMYCTGVGKSILSLLPLQEAEEIWNSEEIQAFSPSTITTFPDMIREMERIRARGYAIDDEEHEPGVRCIAAAIRNWAGAPVAAVSISAPVTRMDQATMDRLLPKLLATVEEISRMLGYAPA